MRTRRELEVIALLVGCAACAATSTGAREPTTTAEPAATRLEPLAIEDDEPVVIPPGRPAVAKVQLPPPPEYPRADVPERYPDGAYSIRGLRASIDERVAEGDRGEEVIVSAWVQEIYVAPPCPEGDFCPPPKQPHFWVTDNRDETGKKRALLVANWRFSIPEWEAKRWKGQPDVVLEVGKRYRFKGKFKRFSDTGFAHSEGLLEFVAYEAAARGRERWVHPRGAPWHPLALDAR